MSTLACTATLYDQRNTTWLSGYSRQGKYSSYLHRGLIVFPQLANNVLKGAKINSLSLRMVCDGAGSASNKTLHIYTTTKTSSGGTSTSWIGTQLGTITGKFYSNTRTFSGQSGSTNTLYNNLVDYFAAGSRSLAIYVNESVPSGASYSTNYLSLNTVTLTIDYALGNTWHWNGAEWEICKPYYHNGIEFIECETYRHDGTSWKQ